MPQHPSAVERAAPETAVAPLIFEQPLNERMRTFLRLDTLAVAGTEKNQPVGQPRGHISLIDISHPRAATCARGTEGNRKHRQLRIRGPRTSTPRATDADQTGSVAHCPRGGGAYLQPLRQFWRPSSIAVPFRGTCGFDLPGYSLRNGAAGAAVFSEC
jgi:hypothetical protein